MFKENLCKFEIKLSKLIANCLFLTWSVLLVLWVCNHKNGLLYLSDTFVFNFFTLISNLLITLGLIGINRNWKSFFVRVITLGLVASTWICVFFKNIELPFSKILVCMDIRSGDMEYLGLIFNAFLSNTLIALVLFIWPYKNRKGLKSFWIAFLLFIIAFLSSENLALYFFPFNDHLYLNVQNPIVSFSKILFCTALICMSLYQDRIAKIKIFKNAAFVLGTLVIVFHALVITFVLYQKNITVTDTSIAQAESFKRGLLEKLQSVSTIEERFTKRIERQKTLQYPGYEQDIENYLKTEKNLIAVSLINDQGQIIGSIHQAGSSSKDEDFFIFNPFVIKNNKNLNKQIFYNASSFKLFFFKPLYFEDKIQGGTVFEVDLLKIIQELKAWAFSQDASYKIECNGSEVLKNTDQVSSFFRESFKFNDVSFELFFKSTSTIPFSKLVNWVIIVLIIGGVFGSLTLSFVVYLFLSLKEKMTISDKLKQKLEISDALLQIMNQEWSLEKSAQKILETMHQYFRFDVLAIWERKDIESTLLVPSIFIASNKTYPNLIEDIKNQNHSKNAFLHQALKERKIQVIQECSLESYMGSKVAKEDGIKGCLLMPLVVKDKAVGVLAFFRNEPLIEEEDFIDFMYVLSHQFQIFLERKEAQEHDKELSSLIENSYDAIYKVDLDLKIQSWNYGAKIMYGYSENEILGQTVNILYPKERIHEIKEIEKQVKQKQILSRYITQRKKKDNTLIWVDNTYSPILNQNGDLWYYSVISRDITKEKMAIEKVQLNEQKLKVFVESTKAWIYEMDLGGNYTFSNPATVQLVGYDVDEIKQKNYLSLALDRQKLIKEFEDSIKNKQGWKRRVWQAITKNGNLIWLEGTADPIFDGEHELIGFRGVERDVTDEILINQKKDEFISMVSHELRTPLTSIYGAVCLLAANVNLDQEQKELLDLAIRNTKRLQGLMDDILDIEKIGLGKLFLKRDVYNLQDLVNEALLSVNEQGKENEIQFSVSHLEQSLFVEVDHDRFLQVMQNLLSNAIKFSQKGGAINITFEIENKAVRVNVKDFGSGIPYDIQAKIFEKFVQGETGNTKVKGSGLGLSIAKGLIEQMGGKIGFFSEPGHGSTFYIDLPIKEKKQEGHYE